MVESLDSNKHKVIFCQEPSKPYEDMLEKCGGDPRLVAGRRAVNKAGARAERGWQPTWDARNPE